MKHRRHLSPFLSGSAAALLVCLCLTSALAASGKVSWNFANVSLNGETKITAGQDITAANGQKVPGTILYTDAAGGKTNYLPIRAISELLGVEVGYDSASKTVRLQEDPMNSSQSWVADGYTGGYVHPDGTMEELPHFSDLFPGQELPSAYPGGN